MECSTAQLLVEVFMGHSYACLVVLWLQDCNCCKYENRKGGKRLKHHPSLGCPQEGTAATFMAITSFAPTKPAAAWKGLKVIEP
mmetsp:Transcript_44306/g.102320  ORF Transcript_44306/g.102320 Transcript_44306/m.102320 type:complete len:84 (+) Transcript_44306:1310-1561(+)